MKKDIKVIVDNMFKKLFQKLNFKKKDDLFNISSPPVSETNSYIPSLKVESEDEDEKSEYYSNSDEWTIKERSIFNVSIDFDSKFDEKTIENETTEIDFFEKDDEEYNRFIELLLSMYDY